MSGLALSSSTPIRQLCEIADAVNYLHEKDIVHGDIKGNNVLVDDDTHCLLCDFGLAKMGSSSTSTEMKGVGTSRWLSPELCMDEPKSFSSDTYAFAMTVVEVRRPLLFHRTSYSSNDHLPEGPYGESTIC